MTEQTKDKLFAIKDLTTGEILIDNIDFHQIQENLDMANEQQKMKGVRQDRPSFCLHIK